MKVSLWAEIHRLREIDGLSERAISKRLHCSRKTVGKALAQQEPPVTSPRSRQSILDPYRPQIDALIAETEDLSAVRVHEEICKGSDGYRGEITLVRDYLRKIRPYQGRIYQEVDHRPADSMQVDWGHCGSVLVGEMRRKLSVFVAVLCFSRLIYIEFTLSQAKEHFYRCIVNAFRFFGGSPRRVIVDNLKAAVAEGSGRHARFHPEFEALCGYHRCEPVACQKRDPESKGVVEGGVGYVKKNALAGRSEELLSLGDYKRLAVYWRDDVANVRLHATTRERPIDRFERERHLLRPLPQIPYDSDETHTLVVTPHARVRFDGNRYSVPPEYVRKNVLLRASDTQIRVLFCGDQIADHERSYEKRQVLVRPEHRLAALARRKRSQAAQIEVHFDALGAEAKDFRLGLLSVPVKPVVHLRRILGLVSLYGKTEVLAAIQTAVGYRTFDAAYVKNLVDQERRRRQLPSPIPLSPRRRDLIEQVDVDVSDPADYDTLFGLNME